MRSTVRDERRRSNRQRQVNARCFALRCHNNFLLQPLFAKGWDHKRSVVDFVDKLTASPVAQGLSGMRCFSVPFVEAVTTVHGHHVAFRQRVFAVAVPLQRFVTCVEWPTTSRLDARTQRAHHKS